MTEETEGSLRPADQEVGGKGVSKKKAPESIQDELDELKEMGKEEYIQRSLRLAKKISEIVPKIADQARREVESPGLSNLRKEDPEVRFKVGRSINRFITGSFEPAEAEDPIRSLIYHDDEFPVTLLSKRPTLSFGPNPDPEASQGAPEWCPIHWVVWEQVRDELRKTSPEDEHFLGLIDRKQSHAPHIFEEGDQAESQSSNE